MSAVSESLAFDLREPLGIVCGAEDQHLRILEEALGVEVSGRGNDVPYGHEVYVAGRSVPVDECGSFVTEHILPEGAHTVEVAVVDEEGAGDLYLRDLEFKENDWFYVGMADVTLAEGEASPAMELLQGDNPVNDVHSNVDGRLAFFVNGKFGSSSHGRN